jgi:AcrR family transcriptional regulator
MCIHSTWINMPRSDEQFERMRDQSRERILRSALTLFARHGFANTSVRMIAEEAGVSQGLPYNYFDGKQALLRAIFERSMEEVQEDLTAASGAASPERSLALLIRSAFQTLRASTDFWRLSYQVRMQPEVLAGLGEQVAAWAAAIPAQIEALLRRGGSADAGAQARVVFAAIDGAAQHYVLDPDRYPLDRVAEQMIRLFAPLAAEPTPHPPPEEDAG